MKLSVIVPIYNIKAEYLDCCIRSLSAESMKEMEILLVDDGSKDYCRKICEQHAAADERIRYIYQENRGVSVARNRGIQNSFGEYLMFVDADDWIEPGICSKAYEIAHDGDLDLLLFGYKTNYINRENLRIMKTSVQDLMKPEVLQLAILQGDSRLGNIDVGTPWAKLIKRSVITENGIGYIEGIKKGQDTLFSLYLLEKCEKISYSPIVGYHYRVSDLSVSKRYNPNIVEVMGATLREYHNFIREYDKGASFETALEKKCVRVFLNEFFPLYFFHKKNQNSSKETNRELDELSVKEPYKSALRGVRGDGMIEKLELALLRGRRYQCLRFVKNAERIVKDIIIKKYE